jgi:cell division inhibitor SepF
MERRSPSPGPEVVLLEPRQLHDCRAVIEAVRAGKTVVVNLAAMAASSGQRLIDLACGGISAMDGQALRLADAVFLFAPALTPIHTP